MRFVVRLWITGLLALMFGGISGQADAQATVKVTSVFSVNYTGSPGPVKAGDPWFGVGGDFTITGNPTSSYTVTLQFANQKLTWANQQFGPGDYWWWVPFDSSLEGPIPCSLTVANTDDSSTASASLSPTYAAHALEYMDAKSMNASQTTTVSFQPNSGTIGTVAMLFGEPQLSGSQWPISNYVAPTGSTQLTTQPDGLTAPQLIWNNVDTSIQSTLTAEYSYTATLRNARVNPATMRTIPWAALSLAQPADVGVWQQSEPFCPTTATEVASIVTKALPANYQTTMTPWDAAKAIFLQVVKSLTYDANHPWNPLNAYDTGQGACGDYSYLTVAALRKIGFAARTCQGWRTGFFPGDADVHVWLEFYMPGAGWVGADPTDSWELDNSGTYAYHFGNMPDLNTRTSASLGGQHIWPLTAWNICTLQVPNWYWSGGATFESEGAATTLLTPSALVVEPSMPYLPQNSQTYARVELQNPAPASGITVQLTSSSSVATVPSNVFIEGGGTMAAFPINSGAVSADTPITISASGGGFSASAPITVKSQMVQINLSPKFSLGGSETVTATLNQAVSTATVVSLSSSASGWLPASITIPANATSATLTVPLPLTSTPTVISVTGALAGQSDTDWVWESVNAEHVTGLQLSPATIGGLGTITATINLEGPAPSGGWPVNVHAGASGYLSMPSSVTVPEGASSATFTITGLGQRPSTLNMGVFAGDSVTTKEAILTIQGDTLTSLTLAPSQIEWISGTSTATVSIKTAAPPGGWIVNLTPGVSGYANMPNSVTIPAGSTSTTFSISGNAQRFFTLDLGITARDEGSKATATLVIAGDAVKSLSINPTTIGWGGTTTATINLVVAAPPGGWPVHTNPGASGYVTMPSTVTVPAGATSATFAITAGSQRSLNLSLDIYANDGPSNQSAKLTIEGDSVKSLSLSPSTITGIGTSTSTVTLASSAPPGGWVLTLHPGAPGLVNMPTTVTVPAGSTTATFTIKGLSQHSSTINLGIFAGDGNSTQEAILTIT